MSICSCLPNRTVSLSLIACILLQDVLSEWKTCVRKRMWHLSVELESEQTYTEFSMPCLMPCPVYVNLNQIIQVLQLFQSNRGVQNFHPDSLNLLYCILVLLVPVILEKKLLCCLMESSFFSALIYCKCLYSERLFNFLNQLDMGLCVK